MLECKNVSVVYGKRAVLSEVNLKCENGKITVLLGRNGSGKSTLVRAVSGNIKYTGQINVCGKDIRHLSANSMAKILSVMPQILQSPDISVRELVSYGRQPYTGVTGILSKSDKQRVEEILDFTGLSELSDHSVKQISGGERQKAYFAMLLCQDTENIILDEPCAHLDALYDKRISEFLQGEKKKNKAILAILHNINFTLDIADFIYVLDNGKCIFSGSSEEFCSSNIAEGVFGLTKYNCKTDGKNKIIYE